MGYTHTFLQFQHSYSIFNTEATLLTDSFVCKNILFGVNLKGTWELSSMCGLMTPPLPKKITTLWWEAWDENTGDSHRVNGQGLVKIPGKITDFQGY